MRKLSFKAPEGKDGGNLWHEIVEAVDQELSFPVNFKGHLGSKEFTIEIPEGHEDVETIRASVQKAAMELGCMPASPYFG